LEQKNDIYAKDLTLDFQKPICHVTNFDTLFCFFVAFGLNGLIFACILGMNGLEFFKGDQSYA